MIVSIDESGDAGFKRSSSSYLVLAMVIIENPKEAEKIALLIKELMSKCRSHPEFKFSKSSDKVRDTFFSHIAKCNIKIRLIKIKKEHVTNHAYRTNPKKFYRYALELLVSRSLETLKNAKLLIDSTGDRTFSNAAKSFLKTPGKTKKIQFLDSKKEPLIQLADMIVGALTRAENSKSGSSNLLRWKKMIEHQIEEEWLFEEEVALTTYPNLKERTPSGANSNSEGISKNQYITNET